MGVTVLSLLDGRTHLGIYCSKNQANRVDARMPDISGCAPGSIVVAYPDKKGAQLRSLHELTKPIDSSDEKRWAQHARIHRTDRVTNHEMRRRRCEKRLHARYAEPESLHRDNALGGWYAILPKPLSGSMGSVRHLTFVEQQQLPMPWGYGVPDGRVVVYASLLHYLTQGSWLFQDCYVNCANGYSQLPLVVGSRHAAGFAQIFSSDRTSSDRGLAIARYLGPFEKRR